MDINPVAGRVKMHGDKMKRLPVLIKDCYELRLHTMAEIRARQQNGNQTAVRGPGEEKEG